LSELGESISRALIETEKLQRTIDHMTNGDLKEEQKKRAQKLKGVLIKALMESAIRLSSSSSVGMKGILFSDMYPQAKKLQYIFNC